MLTRPPPAAVPGQADLHPPRQGLCTGDRGRGRAQECARWGLCLYQLSPLNSCGALRRLQSNSTGAPWGLGSGRPSLCQLCRMFGQLDGMFCNYSPPRIPELRFQEGRERMLAPGGGKETQEVKGESGAHLPTPHPDSQPTPGLREATGHPAPSVVESWSQAHAPGRTGQRVEADKWCQRSGEANLVKSGSVDSLGSGRGRAQDSTLRTSLRLLRFCNRNGSIFYHLCFTDRTLGVQRE